MALTIQARTDALSARPSAAAAIKSWLTEYGAPLSVAVALFVAWELAVIWTKVPVYLFPRPSQILAKIFTDWPLLLGQLGTTMVEILLGFGMSVGIGVPLAIAVVYSRLFEKVAFPFMVSLQTIPKVALAPILVIWFGYGLLPKVLIAFIISFFPIVIGAVIGMRSAEKEMIYLVQSMGAGPVTTFLKIRLPKSLPSMFGGFKIGIGQAVIGAIVGEFIAAEKGLGYLQLVAQTRLDTTLLFACVVVISLVGVILFNLVAWLERLLLPWQRNITEQTE